MNTQQCLTISLITATFNSEKYIEYAIKSVLSQTKFDHLEYIIVDGASSDRTMEIVERYRDSIHIVISEPDKGIYEAFNKGIQAATGDIIYFLNSDDYLYDDRSIEDVLEVFKSNPSAQAVYGNVMTINEINGHRKPLGQRMTITDFEEGRVWLQHQGLFVRKQILEQCGLFDLEYTILSDFDFAIKMFKNHEANCVYFNRIIAVFRIGGESNKLSTRKRSRDESIRIINNHFGRSLIKPMDMNELNQLHYKKWIEMLLFREQPISLALWSKGFRNVAIFGTIEMSFYLLKDLQKSGIQVHVFLDNDEKSHGTELGGVMIHPVTWLAKCAHPIDAVILAFERDHDIVIRNQIYDLLGDASPQVISWREVVVWNFE